MSRLRNPTVALPFRQAALRAQKPLPEAHPKTLRTVGNHLRKRRLDLNLLQKDIAERLGAHEATVNSWENNLRSPPLRFIPRILDFLAYRPCESECQTLGEEIILNRRLLGLSQKKLARYLGVDPGTLSRWKRNQAKPPERLQQKFLAFFTLRASRRAKLNWRNWHSLW